MSNFQKEGRKEIQKRRKNNRTNHKLIYFFFPYLPPFPQTPISMSSMLMHHNTTIFPDPLRFDPERWMGLKKRQRLERYLVNFSKGTRGCVGIK